jgi:hypothetical protein
MVGAPNLPQSNQRSEGMLVVRAENLAVAGDVDLGHAQ